MTKENKAMEIVKVNIGEIEEDLVIYVDDLPVVWTLNWC
jgi:hypothetical protein